MITKAKYQLFYRSDLSSFNIMCQLLWVAWGVFSHFPTLRILYLSCPMVPSAISFHRTFSSPSIFAFSRVLLREGTRWQNEKHMNLHQADLGLHPRHLASGFPLSSYISSCENTEINSTSQSWYKMRWYLENILAQLLTQNEFSIIIRHYCSIFVCRVEIPLPIWI